MLGSGQLSYLRCNLCLCCRFRQPQLQGILFLFHLFLFFIVVQHWQRTLAVLAESNLPSVLLQHDGIIIGSNVHQAHLKQLALSYRRARLALHKQFRLLARLQYVKSGAHHLQAAKLPLLLAAYRQLRGLVKHQLASHLAVLHFQVLHIAYHLPALVHVQKHRVALILFHVHPRRQHSCAVAVQTVVGYSYAFCFIHILSLFSCNITNSFYHRQKTVQSLHTSMQPLHTFLHNHRNHPTFA